MSGTHLLAMHENTNRLCSCRVRVLFYISVEWDVFHKDGVAESTVDEVPNCSFCDQQCTAMPESEAATWEGIRGKLPCGSYLRIMTNW